jgi:excisionase family DNA binding protein
MAELLTFGEAVQHAGVSRQRLNRAIHSGRLAAERGGGPGKLTRIRFEDLRAWCASEGLSLPVEANVRLERAERAERSIPIAPALSSDLVHSEAQQALASLMEPYIERLERSMAQAIEQAGRAL